jgi:hypothetical protein
MTEEDTFRILRRIPYHQMEDIYCAFCMESLDAAKVGEIEKLLSSYGWNYSEFSIEWGNNPVRRKSHD